MTRRSVKILKILTPLSALGSLIAHCVSVFTNEWLYSEESMPNPVFNKTNLNAEPEFLSKHTVSGLWILCQSNPGEAHMNCSEIDYFSREGYQPDPNDSTMAIPHAARRAAYLMIIGGGMILLGFGLSSARKICYNIRITNFFSGILFILSGLCILSAIVVYISTFKTEVGTKLRPKSAFHDPNFRYHYGLSFVFAVVSLMMSELAATFCLFLYIEEHQTSWRQELRQTLNPSHQFYHGLPTLGRPKLQVNVPQSVASYCTKHGGRGRRYSRSKEISREPSPIPFVGKNYRAPSFVGAMLEVSSVRPSIDSNAGEISRRFDVPRFSFMSSDTVSIDECGHIAPRKLSIDREMIDAFPSPRPELYRSLHPPPILEHHDLDSDYTVNNSPDRDHDRNMIARRTTPV
ncbi:stargazin-like protein [Brevipalpus obovatus]|uniref:stargazin-like protein n=1 Tax=Brevipalpus obovatus TaxID=246614 RepID=UPI003D9EE771